MKQQQLSITYAKAICIILMVLGHAGVPAFVHRFSCWFHMPLFFFVSGYLFKEAHLTSFITFFKKKARSIWWPYYLWTCVAILIHNKCLIPLSIADNYYTWQQIGIKMLCAIGMASTESYLLVGFWFLRDLMYALMMAWCIFKLSRQISSKPGQYLFLILAIMASLLMAIAINLSWIWIPNVKTSAFLALSYILSAYLLRQVSFRFNRPYSLWIGLILLVVFWWMSRYFSTSMTLIQGAGNILLYYLLSMASVMALLFFCEGLSRWEIPWLQYIGRNTLDILIFHFPVFKCVSYCLIKIQHLPMEEMSSFHIPGYWLLYSVSALGVCLLIAYLKASCKTWLQGGKEAC